MSPFGYLLSFKIFIFIFLVSNVLTVVLIPKSLVYKLNDTNTIVIEYLLYGGQVRTLVNLQSKIHCLVSVPLVIGLVV